MNPLKSAAPEGRGERHGHCGCSGSEGGGSGRGAVSRSPEARVACRRCFCLCSPTAFRASSPAPRMPRFTGCRRFDWAALVQHHGRPSVTVLVAQPLGASV